MNAQYTCMTKMLLLLLFYASFTKGEFEFSNFNATEVIQDKCNRRPAYKILSTSSITSCAAQCSVDEDCKRFMTCRASTDFQCSLYGEGKNCARLSTDGCSCFIKAYSRSGNKTVCPMGMYGNQCEQTLQDCKQGTEMGLNKFTYWVRSFIKPPASPAVFEAGCDFRRGGSTVIMARYRKCNEVSFNRNFTEYVNGFGDANGDFWIGLEKMKHILSVNPHNQLSVVLKKGSPKMNSYDNITLGSAEDNYPIHLGQYEDVPSKCGDSLTGSVNINHSPFSAPGSDHTSFNCANKLQAGWWFANDPNCSESSLTGPKDNMIWPTSLGNVPQDDFLLRIKPQ